MYPATTMWKTILRLPQPLSNTFLSLFLKIASAFPTSLWDMQMSYLHKQATRLTSANPILVSERGTRHDRIWDVRRPNLGRVTFESGTWRDRIWDVRRPNLGREAPTNIGNESSATFFSTPHKNSLRIKSKNGKGRLGQRLEISNCSSYSFTITKNWKRLFC